MQQVEYIAVEKLTTHPENPRTIDGVQFKTLSDSIRNNQDYFETRPILCNPQMVIFAGNMRYLAAKNIGMKEVPVVVMDIPEKRQRELMIRDNKNNGMWDFDMLANTFDNKELLEYGFTKHDLDLLPKTDTTGMDQDIMTKSLDTFLEGSIKSIALSFTSEEYETIIVRLDRVMEVAGVSSHSEAFIKMLEYWEHGHSSPSKEENIGQ